MPDIMCFGSHLHDFIIKENSFNNLFPLWRLIYGLNKYKGLDYCEKYIKFIKEKGYTFCYMSEIYNLYNKANSPSNP